MFVFEFQTYTSAAETQLLTSAADPKSSTFIAKPQPSVLLVNRNFLSSCVAEPRPSTSSVKSQPSISNTGPSNMIGDVEVLSFRHRDADDTPTPSWNKFLCNLP
jgi:hypothetical protein